MSPRTGKITVFASAAAAGLLAFGAAAAVTHTLRYGSGPLAEYGAGGRLLRVLSGLDLTDDQKTQIKAALKAFRKRLRLTRLDAESRIAGGPLSSGRGSGIVAITPPNQFPQAVWDELVRQGKLKRAGRGTYELGEP